MKYLKETLKKLRLKFIFVNVKMQIRKKGIKWFARAAIKAYNAIEIYGKVCYLLLGILII
jgi:hypothetical protein